MNKYDPKKIYEMYQTIGSEKAAQAIGISRQRIYDILHAAGYSTRLYAGQNEYRNATNKVKINEQVGQTIIKYRKDGLTFREISSRVGISMSNCFKYLKKQGVKTTPDRKLPGCPECSSNPYGQTGLCMKCYRRQRRLQGLD